MVFFGLNGVGKLMMMKLLMGFFVLICGEVIVGGFDVIYEW